MTTPPPRSRLPAGDIALAIVMALTVISNAHWIIESGEWLTFLRTLAIIGASGLFVLILRQ